MTKNKVGRPTLAKMSYMLRVRMCADVLKKLDYLCSLHNKNRSSIIRMLIIHQFDIDNIGVNYDKK